MELTIDGQTLFGSYNDKGELIICLDNVEQLEYFICWNKIARNSSNPKCNVVKDIPFKKITEQGILRKCFPVDIDENEQFAHIVYDLKEITGNETISSKLTLSHCIAEIKKWNKKASKTAASFKETNMETSMMCSEAMAFAYKSCYELLEDLKNNKRK